MSKKIKPVFEDIPSNNLDSNINAKIDVQSNEQSAIIDNSVNLDLNKVGPRSMTNEMREKLEKFDIVINQNKELLVEKSQLTDKLSEYIIEIQQLKSQIDELKTAAIDQKVNGDINILKNEADRLLAENKKLQKSYDEMLMKISDLSFENARLTSQLQQLTNNKSSVNTTQNNSLLTKQTTYSKVDNNGYSSWN